MHDYSETDFIRLCKKQIAEKLQLGGQEGKLRSRDLEYLATAIEESSGIKLSLSTLKRIWKRDYDQTPHPATLNAMVALLGFEDWQVFKQSCSAQPEPGAVAQAARNYSPFIVPAVLCSLLFLAVFKGKDLFGKSGEVKVNGEVTFTADQMESVGVPNSVIFHYDVSQVEADSFFIQQSWNPKYKIRLDPAKHDLSDIYYTPGFHYARLIANDSILRFLPVHIRSDGWLPLVKYDLKDQVPIYLPRDQVQQADGSVRVSSAVLQNAGVDVERDFFLRYYQIGDYRDTYFDNFRLSTRLRADSIRNTVCPFVELMIITERNISYLSLTPKGCVANLDLRIGEHYFSAADNDLSAFGADVYAWQDLELRIKDKNANVWLNGQSIFEQSFDADFGKVVGVIITFKGAGSVEYLRVEPWEENVQVSVN